MNEIVVSRRHGPIAAELLEVDGVRFYHDQALYKEPGGGIAPAHVDQNLMKLAAPTHAYQHENRILWCPGARVGEMIATPRNPVVYSL